MAATDTVKDIDVPHPPRVDVKACPECGARFGQEAAFCPFDGIALGAATWDPNQDRLAGAIVDNRYEVIAPLGEGGMGTVYKVRHLALDRPFAMKVLRHDLATDAELAERFVREARTTAAIKHPAVVAITDFGELADGVPYYVMEMLVGDTLATRLREQGPLPPALASKIARAIADGLAASHAASVIHRDLKPDNVFLVGRASGRAAEDDLRIVDFGASKVMGGSKHTRPGIVFGTPHYMSPEQAGGMPIDNRADVYSLGVLLYEMVTGRIPFEAETYIGVLTKHMFEAPPRPSEVVAPTPALLAIEPVILRALEKDPDRRWQSVAEMAQALVMADGRMAAGAVGVDDTVRRSPVAFAGRAKPKASQQTMRLSVASGIEAIQQSVSDHERSERQRRVRLTAIFAMAVMATLAAVVALVVASRRSDGGLQSVTSAVAPHPPAQSASAGRASAPSRPADVPAPVPDPPPPVAVTAATPAVPPVTAAPPAPATARAQPKAAATNPPVTAPSAASTSVPTTKPIEPPPPPAKPAAPPRRGPDEFEDPWAKK